MRVLTVNAGSTSLKLERYRLAAPFPPLAEPPDPELTRTVAREEAAAVLPQLASEADAIVHRFVRLPDDAPPVVRLDPPTRTRIAAVSRDAPLHNALALQNVEALVAAGRPQYAVSDSAFHRTMPDAAATYALPRDLTARGFRRRGYHGLNHEYAAHRAARLTGLDVSHARIVTLHLGGGSSLCAIANGRSIDTTMGYTPMEGVPMATRSGSVDPGLLIRLLRDGMTVDELEAMLDTRSGLLGMSGATGDVRALLASEDEAAREALAVFTWRVRAALGAMIAVLGGVDLIVFTGGIGEHGAPLRAAIAGGALPWGASLDPARNAAAERDAVVSPDGSRVAVVVVAAREGWQLARALPLP